MHINCNAKLLMLLPFYWPHIIHVTIENPKQHKPRTWSKGL